MINLHKISNSCGKEILIHNSAAKCGSCYSRQPSGTVWQRGSSVTDFEMAAIQAIQSVFPGARVKSSFHLRQAIYRRIQQEGLTVHYEDEQSPLRRWMRQLMAMTALPTFAVPLVWDWTKMPPSVDSHTDAKARSLAEYFERTWVSKDFPASLWTHYDNVGPRSTNVAEGWHNGLNNRFGMSHPTLRLFLDWLQKYQFEVQCRRMQLEAGKPPKPKSPVYAKLDADLWQAKMSFSTGASSATSSRTTRLSDYGSSALLPSTIWLE